MTLSMERVNALGWQRPTTFFKNYNVIGEISICYKCKQPTEKVVSIFTKLEWYHWYEYKEHIHVAKPMDPFVLECFLLERSELVALAQAQTRAYH